MTTPWNLRAGSVNLQAGEAGDSTEMPPETPFRLLVTGNLGGDRADRVAVEQRKPIEIDRDNFDEVLSRLKPQVTLPRPGDGADMTIAFAELDDFGPDRLYRNLPIFAELRELQEQVDNPRTFAQAAAKIDGWTKTAAVAPAPAQPAKASEAAVLEELLAADAAQRDSATGEWERFLRRIALPHLVEKPDPRQADYALVVEQAIGAQMNTILHHPRFQALESAWRSVFLLVQRLPTDARLQIFILDAELDEWHTDLARPDPRESLFVRTVVQHPQDRPWATVVCLDLFGKAMDDLEALASMAMPSARVRTPILAGVSPRIVGCASFLTEPDPRTWKPNATLAGAWEMIRGMEASQYLGVVMPRFLLRLPYGKDATEVEAFAFEEMATPEHEHYLWGSGAVLAGLLLAEGFAADRWQLQPADHVEVRELPVHVFREDGASRMKPCAEVLLRESAVESLMEHGVMVLASERDRDAVHMCRFQSAAKPDAPLAGRWE
jgi:type VI secretion system protein ImpC